MSDETRIREDAYARWEAENRPDGQHERHWREASDALRSIGTPHAWSADHGDGVGASDPSPGKAADLWIRPEKLNSEPDRGTG